MATKLEKKVYKEYCEKGQYSAMELASKNNVPFEYCKACESDMPHHKHICMICGQSTEPSCFDKWIESVDAPQ